MSEVKMVVQLMDFDEEKGYTVAHNQDPANQTLPPVYLQPHYKDGEKIEPKSASCITPSLTTLSYKEKTYFVNRTEIAIEDESETVVYIAHEREYRRPNDDEMKAMNDAAESLRKRIITATNPQGLVT